MALTCDVFAAVREIWQQLNGDRTYQRYVRHVRHAHPEQRPLSREAFYLDRLQRKYSGANRCC